jgi:beta-galactosidase
LKQYHDALFKLNVGCDFILPETEDWSKYKLIVIPPLYISSDDLLIKIRDYVANGGQVLMAFKSGFCNENNGVRPLVMPGILREACGFYYQEFASIWQLGLKSKTISLDTTKCFAKKWAEMIIPEKAQTLVSYNDPFYGKYAAVTQNQFGKGSLTYQGTMLSDEMQLKLFKTILSESGPFSPNEEVVFPVVVKSGRNNLNKQIHYFLNYSGVEKTVKYNFEDGQNLLSEKLISKGSLIRLKPWDLAIVEENK